MNPSLRVVEFSWEMEGFPPMTLGDSSSARVRIGGPHGGSRYRRLCEMVVIDRWGRFRTLWDHPEKVTVLLAPGHVRC